MFLRLFGGLLVAAGILIAGASGLCSLAVVGSAVVSAFSRGGGPAAFTSLGALPAVLFFGGVPFGMGFLLVMGGLALIRRGRGRGPGDG